MSDNDVAFIRGELETLKALSVEKWVSHDKRAEERWSDLMDTIHEMKREFTSHPCQQHGELMVDMNTRVKALEAKQKDQDNKIWAILFAVLCAIGTAIYEWAKGR